MPWFPVDDTAAFHPKLVAAGNAAIGMWARAGAWCAQQLTDGFVPDHMVAALGNPSQAKRLVTVGLWTRESGGYRFHEWDAPGRNLTRKEIEAKRAEERERKAAYRAGKRGGSPPGQTQVSQPESQWDTHGTDTGTPNGQTPDVRQDTQRSPESSRARPRGRAPIPSHPIPSGTGHQSSDPGSARAEIDDDGLDQIASITKGGRDHASRVANDVLDRATTPVRNPLAYVLQAVRDKPESYANQSGRHPPGPSDPRCPTHPGEHRDRCRGCAADRLAARPSADAGVGASDEPPW